MATTAPNMTPDEFDKLKKAPMVAHLKALGLTSGGNKYDLEKRFKDWYKSQDNTASADPSAGSSAGPSAGPSAGSSAGLFVGESEDLSVDLSTEPVNTTVLDPSVHTTVSQLQRLFLAEKTAVSQVVLDAVRKLKYTPGKSFRRKGTRKDLSELLRPLGSFTDTFLRVIDSMVLTPQHARNLVSVRINMVAQMPNIRTDAQLVPFFQAWGIRAIGASKSPSPRPDTDEERQMQTAIQASMASAAADRARSEEEDDDMLMDDEFEAAKITAPADDEAEKSRKAILQELDIFNSAIMHRLARWTREFPKPKPEDTHWPGSFDVGERKQIRDFIRGYIEDNDLWLKDIDASELSEAVDEIKDDADFPIAHARIAAVIQLCFIDLRGGKKRHSETPSATSSRTASPVKLSIEGGGEGDEGDDGVDQSGSRSSPTASARGKTARGNSRGRPRSTSRGRPRGTSSGRPRGTSRGRPRGATRGLPAGRGGGGSGSGSGSGGTAAKRKASSMADEDDDDDDPEEEEVVAPGRPKRARTRLSMSYTAQDLEEQDDEDVDAAMGDEDEDDDE